MGQAVCRAVCQAEDLQLVAAVDPANQGAPLSQVVGGEVPALEVLGQVSELDPAGVQVVVDFTVAASARQNLAWCAAQGVHAVVGTTGLSQDDMDQVRTQFEGSGANALIAPNFAIGALLLMHLCEVAAPHMDSVEIIELHHDQKRDAPSGTAVRTAERLAAARRAADRGALPPDPTTTMALEGARGGAGPGGVRVHSVRLPGLVAHQEVIFGAPGETLTVRHDATDRVSFMAGVLLGIRAVGSRPGVTIGLEPVLGW